MASIRYENDRGRKGWRLQFRDVQAKKRTVWLGGTRESVAQDVKEQVEHLLETVRQNRPPEKATTKWLATIDDKLRNALARCGLCDPVEVRIARDITVSEFVKRYIEEKQDVKKSTRQTYDKAQANLEDYFGQKKKLRDVTVADARSWRNWLKTRGNRRDKQRKDMAEATVRRRTGMVKQFFREAISRGYLQSNPFEDLVSTAQGNPKRQHFVEVAVIESCMDHCPCGDWRTILALARYGGLRIPSELVALRWSDIDLPGGKMMINASKTEHHSSGGLRVCPIFPELRPYLEQACDNAVEGDEFVINRYRNSTQNLRQTFQKILKRAGVVPWPRLFQNLRASRETELMAKFPAKDVASWLGNTQPIAMKHYAMATEVAFQEAANPQGSTVQNQSGGCLGGSISGISGAIREELANGSTVEIPYETGALIVEDSAGQYWLVGDEGLEPPTSSV